MEYQELCEKILNAVGGKENVTNAFHCVTRLRLTLADQSKLDRAALEAIPEILKVNVIQTQIQIVLGDKITAVYETFVQMCGLQGTMQLRSDGSNTAAQPDGDAAQPAAKMSPLARLTECVSKIMMPLVSAMIAFGLLKGFTMLANMVGLLASDSPTYTFLYNIGDSVIYFIPMIAAYSASRYFNTNSMVSIILACMLFNPKITALLGTEGGAKIFGFIPLGNVSYASTVIPVILMILVQCGFERLTKKLLPKAVRGVFGGMITVFFTSIITFTVVGPLGALMGTALSTFYTWLYGLCPPLAGAVVGGLWALLVSWGMHTALVPIVVNNLAVLGYDTLMAFASCGNWGQFGGLFATYFRAKDKRIKQNALSLMIATATQGFGGTEPTIYGNNLGLKTPFLCGLLGGAAGGIVCSLLDVRALTVGAFSIYKFAIYAGSLTGILVSLVVAFGVGFVGTWVVGFKEDPSQIKEVL